MSVSAPEILPVVAHDPIGSDAWILRLQLPEWSWEPGQLVSLFGESDYDVRDYTICSSPNDDTLDVIYRPIAHGVLTPQLRKLKLGDPCKVAGPYGTFTIRDRERPLLCCATGTGIAPFRSFIRSHPRLDMTLLHGVRVPQDLYFKDEFEGKRATGCCTREAYEGRQGRLTELLPTIELADNIHVYLCGANEMIYEATEILEARGVPAECIFNEAYYYRFED